MNYFLFFYRFVSRTAYCEEMDEDFVILKMTNLGNFYIDYCNRKGSLEYVICKINDKNQDIISYKNISKSQKCQQRNK